MNLICKNKYDSVYFRKNKNSSLAEVCRLLQIDPESHRFYERMKEFWLLPNGQYHRKYGPAVISNGTKEWWQNGKRHREGGPAIIKETGESEWWIHGKRASDPNLIHYQHCDPVRVSYGNSPRQRSQN